MLGNLSTAGRYWVTTVILLGGILAVHEASGTERIPLRQPLDRFPGQLGGWRGVEVPLDPRMVQAAGVDDYLSRAYAGPSGDVLQVYIGYYKSQRTGDTIHSPKNCLPGGGWFPVESRSMTLTPLTGEQVVVNEYVVKKGLDAGLVVYWYQFQGRVVASEYWAKAWMVADALTRRRTDGALIRIWAPITGDEEQARNNARVFANLIYPRLAGFIPN